MTGSARVKPGCFDANNNCMPCNVLCLVYFTIASRFHQHPCAIKPHSLKNCPLPLPPTSIALQFLSWRQNFWGREAGKVERQRRHAESSRSCWPLFRAMWKKKAERGKNFEILISAAQDACAAAAAFEKSSDTDFGTTSPYPPLSLFLCGLNFQLTWSTDDIANTLMHGGCSKTPNVFAVSNCSFQVELTANWCKESSSC